MERRRARWTATALGALTLLAACGSGGGGAVKNATGGVVRLTAARATPSADARRGAVIATTAFSADLYRAVTAKAGSGNVVLSPYSVAVGLAMPRVGAKGLTAAETDKVLHSPAGGLDAGLNVLDQELAKRSGTKKRADGSSATVSVWIANAMWAQQGLAFKRAFLDTLARDYGAGVRVVDYKTAAEPARTAINDWVAGQTHDKIRDLLAKGTIDSSTRLVLTDAVYLKAPWEHPFAKGVTAPAPFHRLDGTQVDAPTMRLSDELAYASGTGYQAVELPYAGGELSMVVVVPDAGTFDGFERSLDGAKLGSMFDGLKQEHVNLRLPKFTFTTSAALRDALAGLGMQTAFTDRADFSGITADEPLAVSDVVHKAFIAVDEQGTEAAAATATLMVATAAPAMPVDLFVDRPFLFAIRDVQSGAVLFVGRVADPTAS